MNQCYVCGISFNTFSAYHEHTSLGHEIMGLESKDIGLATHSSGRKDLEKRVYPGPMPREEKARIVARGERRLGAYNFFGRK